MATFRKRSSGSWQARIQRKGYPDITKSFKTRSEATEWARKVEHELDLGLIPKVRSKALVRDLLTRYLTEVTPHKKGAQVEVYRINKWLRHPIADLEVSSVSPQVLAQWRDTSINKGLSPNSIRLELAVLSHMFNIAKAEWGYHTLVNPADSLRTPKLPRGRTRRVTQEELERIARESNSTVLPLIMKLAVETAMRRGEIAELRWENINFRTSTLLLPTTKNGEAREVPLSSRALKVLKGMPRASHGLVFDITPHAISVAFIRACKRAGIHGLNFHDIRHEAISRLFERGLMLPEVATISGHKTWAMLSRYTHLKAQSLVGKLEQGRS